MSSGPSSGARWGDAVTPGAASAGRPREGRPAAPGPRAESLAPEDDVMSGSGPTAAPHEPRGAPGRGPDDRSGAPAFRGARGRERRGRPGRERRHGAVYGAAITAAVIPAAAVVVALAVTAHVESATPRAIPQVAGSDPAVQYGRAVPSPQVPPTAPAAAMPPPAPADPPGPGKAPSGPRPPEAPGIEAAITPVGALVRARPGIVGLRVRNIGTASSAELVATVHLPPGVVVLVGRTGGRGGAAVEPVGTVDGWSCRSAERGAQCTRGPLAKGGATTVFLRVLVSPQAAEGTALAARITAGDVRMVVRAPSGVRVKGAAARFAADGRVGAHVIGNTLLSCPWTHDGCVGEGGPEDMSHARPDGGARDVDLWPMRLLDQDDDPDTRSSSAARLTLPAGARVVWAGLYWSASGPAGAGGQVKFRPPGAELYLKVNATEVRAAELPGGTAYQAFADVTRLVAGAVDRPGGLWWVADAPLRPGVSQHAGWSLVLVVAEPRRPYGQAVVLDTATVVDAGESLALPLGGLAPAATPARLGLVTWEGDRDLVGDRVLLGDVPLRPSGGGGDPENVFDGSAAGAVGRKSTFGVDVDTFRVVLGRSPVVRVSTHEDAVLVGVLVAVVPMHS